MVEEDDHLRAAPPPGDRTVGVRIADIRALQRGRVAEAALTASVSRAGRAHGSGAQSLGARRDEEAAEVGERIAALERERAAVGGVPASVVAGLVGRAEPAPAVRVGGARSAGGAARSVGGADAARRRVARVEAPSREGPETACASGRAFRRRLRRGAAHVGARRRGAQTGSAVAVGAARGATLTGPRARSCAPATPEARSSGCLRRCRSTLSIRRNPPRCSRAGCRSSRWPPPRRRRREGCPGHRRSRSRSRRLLRTCIRDGCSHRAEAGCLRRGRRPGATRRPGV